MSDPVWPTPTTRPDAFERMPGLYRRWEAQRVPRLGGACHIEEAGTATDGTQLFAVYRRRHLEEEIDDE